MRNPQQDISDSATVGNLANAQETSLHGLEFTNYYEPARKSLTPTHGVCLDGTLPGYHLHCGHGSGANSWLIQLERGGWCNNVMTCLYRKKTQCESSNDMETQLQFTGILSDKARENSGFVSVLTSFETRLYTCKGKRAIHLKHED
ncbi:unnamed protein product, partial [Thlaspi arvense]